MIFLSFFFFSFSVQFKVIAHITSHRFFPWKKAPWADGQLKHNTPASLVLLWTCSSLLPLLPPLLDSLSFPRRQLIARWTRFGVLVGMDHICRRPTVLFFCFFYLSPAVTRGATCLLVRRSGTDAPLFSEGLASNWLLLFIECGSDFATHASTFH